MLHAHRPTARLLLHAFALALLCPLGAAAAPAAAAPADLATCRAGSELQQQTRRTRVAVRGPHGTTRHVTRLTTRWACVEDRTAPGRVRGISAVPGDGQVSLAWRASEDDGGIAGYEIYRDGHYVVTIASTTFTDPSLVNGVAHQYRVFAVDMARNLSAPSGIVWAMPRSLPDRQAPAAPLGLAATADKAGLTVTLRWSPSTDDKGVVGYRIYRDGLLAGVSTTPSFTDVDRSHGTEYRYAVVALDAAGNISAATPVVSTYVS